MHTGGVEGWKNSKYEYRDQLEVSKKMRKIPEQFYKIKLHHLHSLFFEGVGRYSTVVQRLDRNIHLSASDRLYYWYVHSPPLPSLSSFYPRRYLDLNQKIREAFI